MVTQPPRKRAPAAKRALRAVPDPEPPAAIPLGKNKAHQERQREQHSGPDLPPGLPMAWLPSAEEVPPKPKREPKMDYPGVPFRRDGFPEWQLFTDFAEDGSVVKRSWKPRWVPPDDFRCIARAVGKTNPWQANRCVQPRIKGAKVCRFHGGNLPNVKKAAQARLATAALPAAERLIHIALKQKGVKDSDRIKAIIEILDRAGVSGKQTVEVELSVWQKTLQDIYGASLRAEGAEEAEEVPGAELVEGEDYVLEDDEEDWDDGSDD